MDINIVEQHVVAVDFKPSRLLIFWLCLIFRYSPPQVCRKLKIQDILKKYRQELSVPDFFVSLFANENS